MKYGAASYLLLSEGAAVGFVLLQTLGLSLLAWNFGGLVAACAAIPAAWAQLRVAAGFGREAAVTNEAVGGKLIVITGANTGIGFIAARALAKAGAKVVLACRSKARGEAAMAKLKAAVPHAQAVLSLIDLADLDSVKAFAERLPADVAPLCPGVTAATLAVDVLVNNGGLYQPDKTTTPQGHEFVLGVNHLGPYLLTELLLPALKRAKNARVVNVASVAHTTASDLRPTDRPQIIAKAMSRSTQLDNGVNYYGLSKMCNVVHASHLAATHGICAVSLHPGGVLTEVFRALPAIETFFFTIGRCFMKTAWAGAQTTLHCICAPTAKAGATVPNGSAVVLPGGYYCDCRLREDCRVGFTKKKEEIDAVAAWSRQVLRTHL